MALGVGKVKNKQVGKKYIVQFQNQWLHHVMFQCSELQAGKEKHWCEFPHPFDTRPKKNLSSKGNCNQLDLPTWLLPETWHHDLTTTRISGSSCRAFPMSAPVLHLSYNSAMELRKHRSELQFLL